MASQPRSTQRKHRGLIITASIVAGLALLAIIGGVWVVIGFSGGLARWDVRHLAMPDFSASPITDDRQKTAADLARDFDALLQPAGLTYYRQATDDRCYQGQHNYEVSDDYLYRCSYRLTRFYGFDAEFRSTLLAFDKTLQTKGWRADTNHSLSWMITNYYDRYYGPAKPKLNSYPNGYFVSDLPRASYAKDITSMNIEFAESGSAHSLLATNDIDQHVVGNDGADDLYTHSQFVDPSAVFRYITSRHKYMVVLSAEADYYNS
jgi:hypothetical protein